MPESSIRTSIRRAATVIDYLAALALVWTGWAISMQPERYATLEKLIVATKDYAPPILVVAVLVDVLARLVKWLVKSKSACEENRCQIVNQALAKFRKTCFPDVPNGEPLDNNRVTLFKRVAWKWRLKEWRNPLWPWGWWRFPGSGWLVAVNRSGHATQGSSSAFLAPDDAPQAEGVAGRAWRGDGTIRVPNLPDLSATGYVGYLRAIWLHF